MIFGGDKNITITNELNKIYELRCHESISIQYH